MAIAAWLLIMAFLTWFFAGVEERRYNPNQQVLSRTSEETTKVVLRRNRWGHYVATGEINHKPVTFVVDTGATHVAIPLHLQQFLELERGLAIPINTANGTSTAYLTTIPHLTLGELTFHDVPGGLAKGMTGEEVLLGMSVLSNLTIIQQGDRLILRK